MESTHTKSTAEPEQRGDASKSSLENFSTDSRGTVEVHDSTAAGGGDGDGGSPFHLIIWNEVPGTWVHDVWADCEA